MYYNLNKIMKKMEVMLDQADIPYTEPDSIAFSFDTGSALGTCYIVKPEGADRYHFAIRIHPYFDSPDVPLPYVESLVCHELIHCDIDGQHGDQWEKRAKQFVHTFPQYDLPALSNDTWGLDINGDGEDLPFNTDDYAIYCPHCGKRMYFRPGQKYSIAHYLERPCPNCGGEMQTLSKGRKTFSSGRTKLHSLQDLRTTYKGEFQA